MKKLIVMLTCCLMLTGCAPSPADPTEPTPPVTEPETTATETTEPETTEPTQTEIGLNVFVPNENADDFYTIPTVIEELDGQAILDLLIEHSMLNEDIQLNRIELAGRQLNLDFNQAFTDQLLASGTAGERMLIGCVVNTFLSVYDADTVYITVDGNVVESGHVIYDFPIEFMD